MSRLTYPASRTSTLGQLPVHRRWGTRPGPWRWLCATEAGVAVEGPAVRFDTDTAAQQWLDGNADALRRQRIASVTLLDGEHVVDGPLPLR